MKNPLERRFVLIRCHAVPGQSPVDLQWRVIEVDRLWKRVQMPTAADCYAMMAHHVDKQLGPDVPTVVVDQYNSGELSLHPDTLKDLNAALAADALRGIRD